MLTVFEVYVFAGRDAGHLLSEETLRDTRAQVMTLAEAEAIGFSGIKPDPRGRETRLIAVAARDAQWVHRQLEANPDISSYRVHEVED